MSNFLSDANEDDIEVLTLDHSGKLVEIGMEVKSTDYVLQLPTKIEHDEPLSNEVLKKYIMLPAAPRKRQVPVRPLF